MRIHPSVVGAAFAGLWLVLLSAKPCGSTETLPNWIREAASTAIPPFGSGVSAIVLLDEQSDIVDSTGRMKSVSRYVVKLLTREGRYSAVARVGYTTDTGKIEDLRAWLIRDSGTVKRYGKTDVIDAAVVDFELFNNQRTRTISAQNDAEPGSVFAYEAVSEDRNVLAQSQWGFQSSGLPVIRSRYSLTLPEGWRVESYTFDHAKVEPKVEGNTSTWELSYLPPIPDEEASRITMNALPRLSLSYFPPAGKAVESLRVFKTWTDVSRYLSELHDPQTGADQAVASKAKALTSNAATEKDRIAAIGRFVQQKVQYVAIEMNLGRGGGFKPRTADEVYAKSYGDCKDKSNLMRAMLKAVGIPAYPVAIYSGNPTRVREEWASPGQFNHCILAVKVSAETQGAAVVDAPRLGRLLLFDPTDQSTSFGDLPGHEQNSLALVIAGESGQLVRMPATAPEENRTERSLEGTLSPDGSVAVKFREESTGQSATLQRGYLRNLSSVDYRDWVQKWIRAGATSAVFNKVEPTDDGAAGTFRLDVEFKATRYGQLMQQRMLIFRPAIVPQWEAFTAESQDVPLQNLLGATSSTEHARFHLPAGFAVDELPEPLKIETPFGVFTSSCEAKGGDVECTRKLVTTRKTVAVLEFEAARQFLRQIRSSEQNPIVLMKN